MNEQSPLSPNAQSSAVIVETPAYKRPQKRPSSCGCNKRTRPTVTSNNIKNNQIHALQNDKLIKQEKNVRIPQKQVNSTASEPTPEEKSVLFAEPDMTPHSTHSGQQSYIEENSLFKKVIKYLEKILSFQWLMKRNDR